MKEVETAWKNENGKKREKKGQWMRIVNCNVKAEVEVEMPVVYYSMFSVMSSILDAC